MGGGGGRVKSQDLEQSPSQGAVVRGAATGFQPGGGGKILRNKKL